MFEDISKKSYFFGIDHQCIKDHQLYLQSWLVVCENEKGLWWRYRASEDNKIYNKLHRLRKSSKKMVDLKIFISDE